MKPAAGEPGAGFSFFEISIATPFHAAHIAARQAAARLARIF